MGVGVNLQGWRHIVWGWALVLRGGGTSYRGGGRFAVEKEKILRYADI